MIDSNEALYEKLIIKYIEEIENILNKAQDKIF